MGSYYGIPSDASELCGIRVQASNSFSSNQEAQKALDKIIQNGNETVEELIKGGLKIL